MCNQKQLHARLFTWALPKKAHPTSIEHRKVKFVYLRVRGLVGSIDKAFLSARPHPVPAVSVRVQLVIWSGGELAPTLSSAGFELCSLSYNILKSLLLSLARRIPIRSVLVASSQADSYKMSASNDGDPWDKTTKEKFETYELPIL